AGVGAAFSAAFRGLHEYTPFGVIRFAMERPPAWAQPRIAFIEWLGFLLALGLLGRAAMRLQGDFHAWHYKPATEERGRARPALGDRPLTWWAVKRVSRYSGRINLWLAGGFGIL